MWVWVSPPLPARSSKGVARPVGTRHCWHPACTSVYTCQQYLGAVCPAGISCQAPALGQNLNLEIGRRGERRRAHDQGVAGMGMLWLAQCHSGWHQDMLQSKEVPPTRHILPSPGAKGKVGFPALLASTATKCTIHRNKCTIH